MTFLKLGRHCPFSQREMRLWLLKLSIFATSFCLSPRTLRYFLRRFGNLRPFLFSIDLEYQAEAFTNKGGEIAGMGKKIQLGSDLLEFIASVA